MRQVPLKSTTPYLIIGNGRAATHFCHYFKLLQIPFQQWSRQNNPIADLAFMAKNCKHILILIKDSQIENFIKENHCLQNKSLVHFSASLSTSLAFSAHPLMTFSPETYDLATYQKIPFILEKEGPEFDELLPGLINPHYKIPRELKNLYHSLCVISGNFTTLLWQKFFSELETTLQLPKAVAYPYLEQIFNNLRNAEKIALTGPLARNDQATITANIAALSNDPFQKIYLAFVDAYQTEKNS